MKIKIEIKNRFTGKILFEFETENNNIRTTITEAVKHNADLRDADLRDADLRDAYLRGAYLRGANLRGADLRGAYLRGADLRDADLRDADLRDANLQGAYLRGAGGEKITIKTTTVFTGLYTYICMPIIAEGGNEYIKMGCYTRLLSDWDSDFWNNENEFPNDGSLKSTYRVMAFEFCKKWIELNRNQ